MGRATAGVAAIRLAKGDEVVGMDVIHADSPASLLIVTSKGMGKRTHLKEFPRQGRAGGGVRAITVIEKGGPIRVARVVNVDDDLVVISTNGQVIRMFADAIPHKGRPAQGVAVMNMKDGDEVASIARIPRTDKSGKMISDEELEVLTEEHVEQNGTGGKVVAQAAPAEKLPAPKLSSVKLPAATNGRVSKNGAATPAAKPAAKATVAPTPKTTPTTRARTKK